ncbi:MAG: hypothetical protein IBJ11_08500 [Phycisphaerales bacterium]|nr:hypothetical protein [Phycisphaerales bacterium]
MNPEPRTTVTLRALEGAPLDDPVVRDIVVATAHAIAERNGVTIWALEAGPDSITVTLEANRLAAIGFAAELRRLTTNWYRAKFREDHLWGEPRAHDHDDTTDWQI